MASFDEVLKDCTKLGTKIPTSEYLESGKYPIIDQGQNDIAGYYDSDDGLFEDVPTIVFGDHTRVVKYVDKPCFLGADGVKLLCPLDKDINCKYLFYQLSCADIPNTGYNRHFKWVKALDFKIPSSDEQNHVVEVLDKVTELISLRKQQLAKLDELVKARFVEMFGDEQAFNKEPLSQNVEEMFIGPFGSSLKNENFVSKENGYCMVYEQKHAIRKTMDVETRYIDKPKYEELKRFSIHGGDIIVSCRGTIGETYIVPLNAPLGIMHPSIMKIRVKDSIYNRVFFDFLLQEKLKQHEAQANGSGVKMAVTASALGKEEFIVPSIPFQNQFAAFVERVDQQKQTVQQSLEKLELMKKALMQEYFG